MMYMFLIFALMLFIFMLFFLKNKRNRGYDVIACEEKASVEMKASNMDELQIETLAKKISEVLRDRNAIFDSKFSLNVLSAKVSSNKTYVSWIINNRYKKNFSTLLNEVRIAEACRMLDDNTISSNYTIQSVYESLGYTTASSFIRQFKKIKGVTPSEYRKKKKVR